MTGEASEARKPKKKGAAASKANAGEQAAKPEDTAAAEDTAASETTAEEGEAAAAATDDIAAGAPDLVESDTDTAETRMTYDPNAHTPLVMVGIWIAAMIGLGIYSFTYYVGDLSKWGSP